MKKAYALSWIFCWLSLLGYAQSGQDYLLTLNQDTLYGKIVTESNGLAPITFIYEKQRMNYTPASIRFFGIFRDTKYQHFKTLQSKMGKTLFVQIMASGKMNLYKYSEEHIFAHSTLRRYVYLMGMTDNALTTLSSSSYHRILGDLLKDKPFLLKQLANTTFSEVPQLMEAYNKL